MFRCFKQKTIIAGKIEYRMSTKSLWSNVLNWWKVSTMATHTKSVRRGTLHSHAFCFLRFTPSSALYMINMHNLNGGVSVPVTSWRQLIQTRGENRTVNSRIVFYNRVDKCGSSTLSELFSRYELAHSTLSLTKGCTSCHNEYHCWVPIG